MNNTFEHMDEVGPAIGRVLTAIHTELKEILGEGFKITDPQEDKIFDVLHEVLETYSLGDYKNYN